MNHAAYIDALERSAKNLPGLLHDWATVDDELRLHYSEALLELLVTYDTARAVARPAEQQRLATAWAAFVKAVVRNASEISACMKFDPLEILQPASVSHPNPTPDAFEVAEPDDLSVAA